MPSGELGIYIDEAWYYASRSVRVTWRDGKRQRLENCLGAIVVAFVEAAKAIKEDRQAREEQERQWRDEERRRRLARWEAMEHERRCKALDEELSRWRLCTELRAYVEMRTRRGPSEDVDPSKAAAWFEWITRYADSIEEHVLESTGPTPEPFDENSYRY